MKVYWITLIFSVLSFSTFGKEIYTLSKEDFVQQFNDRFFLDPIYCQNEKGMKVWLSFLHNSILIAKLKDHTEKKWMLQSVKYVQGEIQAVEATVWMPSREVQKSKFRDVAFFTIEGNPPAEERPYWDMNPLRLLNTTKNDSIQKHYSVGTEKILLLILKKKRRQDTLLIMENACYNLKFKNNLETVFGVVQKITQDSIQISNRFNPSMAKGHQIEFKIYHFPIHDIQEVQLLKTGGYSYKKIPKEAFQLVIRERKKQIENAPLWYSFNSRLGELDFYRLWLAEEGFIGIEEKEGKPVFYER